MVDKVDEEGQITEQDVIKQYDDDNSNMTKSFIQNNDSQK